MPGKAVQLAELEQRAAAPDFWADAAAARQMMRTANGLRTELQTWHGLSQRLADARELQALNDPSLNAELEAEVTELETTANRLDFETILSGERDDSNCILQLHSGAGGVDSQDFADMLMRMYLRWGERAGFSMEVIDQSPGEEAGLKSVAITVTGRYAYGYLKAERGVHRLVRLSPFDAARRRHTSFVLAEVIPEVEEDGEVVINPKDLQIDTFRSAGAGGQHVQKNETAIRITHLPTGVVAQCQNERSQTQNREVAMKVLRARLSELQRLQRVKEISDLKGDYIKAEWGSQIRSYVLHPYQMVKDHRTGFETGNSAAVLDGDVTGFMEAFLRANVT